MNELIKVESRNGIETVNARELHVFLGSKQDFSTWIKKRIEKFGFAMDIDFCIAPQNYGTVNGGFGIRNEYYISLDMAKELSMVENNDKGKEARKYFIEVEKRAKNLSIPFQNDARIDRLENMVEKLCLTMANLPQTIAIIAQGKQIEFIQDYYTIKGYASKQGVAIAFSDAYYLGKAASKLSREKNIEIRKADDEKFGVVNSYHVSVLKEVFTQ